MDGLEEHVVGNGAEVGLHPQPCPKPAPGPFSSLQPQEMKADQGGGPS